MAYNFLRAARDQPFLLPPDLRDPPSPPPTARWCGDGPSDAERTFDIVSCS